MGEDLEKDLKLPFKQEEKKVMRVFEGDSSNDTMWKCWFKVIIPVAFCAKIFPDPGQPGNAQGYLNKLDVSIK